MGATVGGRGLDREVGSVASKGRGLPVSAAWNAVAVAAARADRLPVLFQPRAPNWEAQRASLPKSTNPTCVGQGAACDQNIGLAELRPKIPAASGPPGCLRSRQPGVPRPVRPRTMGQSASVNLGQSATRRPSGRGSVHSACPGPARRVLNAWLRALTRRRLGGLVVVNCKVICGDQDGDR